MSLPERFPGILMANEEKEDHNPAIRLFGKRFVKEQTIPEYLAEFLAVIFSKKWLGESSFSEPLPSLAQLRNWPDGSALKYKPPIKLNLKLFALLGVCRIDARHPVHTEQHNKLQRALQEKINSHGATLNVNEWLEEFLRGFQGAGFERAWCAQTFFPISSSLLTKETIWNEGKARKERGLTWSSTLNSDYYGIKRAFLARGGEMLFLHLCNTFTIDQVQINEFGAKLLSIEPSCVSREQELTIENLYLSLQSGFNRLQGPYTKTIDKLVDLIETLDPETYQRINTGEPLSCQWCPRDSWKEGLLFTIELNRLLANNLDPIERLELMMTGCALHVLRSLSAQSARYNESNRITKGVFNYAWIFSASNTPIRQNRIVSQRNLEVNQSLIQGAIHNKDLLDHIGKNQNEESFLNLLKEAEDRYGHKLFLSLGKRLGIISPKKGPGARFIMTDRVLRYFVLVLIRPGESCTYDDFLTRLYLHFGIAVEGGNLSDAAIWSGLIANQSIQAGNWLQEMLSAGGFLMKLSDACSIVRNPFTVIPD